MNGDGVMYFRKTDGSAFTEECRNALSDLFLYFSDRRPEGIGYFTPGRDVVGVSVSGHYTPEELRAVRSILHTTGFTETDYCK